MLSRRWSTKDGNACLCWGHFPMFHPKTPPAVQYVSDHWLEKPREILLLCQASSSIEYCDITGIQKMRFSKATVEIIFTDQIFLADRHQWCSRDEKAGASTLPAEERLPNSRPPHATQKKPHDTLHAWLWRRIVSDALKDVQQPPFRGNRRRDVGRKARIMLAPHCPSYPQSESRCNKARLQPGDQKLLKSTLFEIQIVYLFQLFWTK